MANIIGHEKIVGFFEKAIADKRLAQVYCLAGPSQVGKRTIAKWVASKLLDVPENKLTQHADFYYLERTIDAEGRLRKDFLVDQSRGLKERLGNKPWLGGYQVMIVDEAELLNRASGNALLKVLEEPPEKTVMFLLTENDAALLPTVRSRCQGIACSVVPDDVIAEGLKAIGTNPEEIETVLPLAWGRPGRAKYFLENVEARQTVQDEIERWQKLQGKPFYEQVKIIEDAFGDPDDAVRGRERLGEILDVWTMQSRQALLNGADQTLVATIDYLTEARRLLQQNVHPKLIMEQAVLRF